MTKEKEKSKSPIVRDRHLRAGRAPVEAVCGNKEVGVLLPN